MESQSNITLPDILTFGIYARTFTGNDDNDTSSGTVVYGHYLIFINTLLILIGAFLINNNYYR